jgi:transcriptional regulator with XRE-family HTH domain
MNTLVNPAGDGQADVELLEEAALALAQSVIQNAIDESGVSRAEVARRMERNRSFVSRMLSGSHNLTVKTMARSLAACGFEVRFERVPIASNWIEASAPSSKKIPPAHAGSTILASLAGGHSTAHVF